MRKSVITKVLKKIISLLPYAVLAFIGIPIIGMGYTEGLKMVGLRTIPVPVVGTGSMYPSLFWAKSEGGPEDENTVVIEEYRSTPHLYKRYGGITIFGKKYLERTIQHGDMVTFQNDKTKDILREEGKDEKSGFIKRVIGVPGDTIELRDGFVYVNGGLLAEPYITQGRSTYGGEFLKDCQKLSVPEGHYFVLGDNRKVSSDSRFDLGLISKGDISYVLPLSEQKIYHPLWRDPSKDEESIGEPTLSGAEFVHLVNEVRSSKKIASLKISAALTQSASKRGVKLLHDPKTSYDMKQAISDTGYSNIVLGEFVSHGRFSAKELLENLLFNAPTAKQILNAEFSDLGIIAVNREVDGCPSQVIVGHLGGYIPATYDQEAISSWRGLADSISSVLPSWESAVGHDQVDQSKLTALLNIFYRRLELAREIVTTMEKKDWLSESQQARIKADQFDATQAEVLVRELNKE
jgi:signal peptidase I